MEERKLTFKEKMGVLAAIIMFFGVGMIMGGNSAGNMKLLYTGAAFFATGGVIAVWLLIDSKKNEKDDEDFYEG
jgi:hypothetical protein